MGIEEDVERYFEGYIRILRAVEVTDDQGNALSLGAGIRLSVELIRECARRGGKIMFIGNGGSAAIASHFALDYWHAGGVRALSFNDGSQLTCLSNDHGYDQVFALPVRKFADPNDILVAISSSGRSPNILYAVRAAREKGCKVLTLSGFGNDNPLRRLGNVNFYLPISHYGYVESAHAVILHCILDTREREQH